MSADQCTCDPKKCKACTTSLLDAWDKVHGAQAEAEARIAMAEDTQLEHGRMIEDLANLLNLASEKGAVAVSTSALADVLKQHSPAGQS